jgi:hypothetical protein
MFEVSMLVYMFSMSKEHILISLLTSMVCRSVIRWMELRILYIYNSAGSYVRNVCVEWFANSYAGVFFQLIIGLTRVFGLCNFLWCGSLVVLDSCLHISIRFLFVWRYIVLGFVLWFLVVLCWVVVDYCEFVIMYEVIYFMFLFLLHKYSFSFACFCYGKFICYFVF